MRNLKVVSQGIKGHLDPVVRQAEYAADLVEGGVYDLGGERTFNAVESRVTIAGTWDKDTALFSASAGLTFNGVTLEAGNVWNDGNDMAFDDVIIRAVCSGVSIPPIGPVYLA